MVYPVTPVAHTHVSTNITWSCNTVTVFIVKPRVDKTMLDIKYIINKVLVNVTSV